MNLFAIHEKLSELLDKGFDEDCIDYETGELLEEKANEKITQLQLDEAIKIENIALYLKNLDAEAEAINAEEKIMAQRRKAKEKKYDWLRGYLSSYLKETGKMKFESAKCLLSFRKSEKLEIINTEKLKQYTIKHDEYLKYSEPVFDIAKIKTAVKNGVEIDGVVISEYQNLQIK